MQEKEDLIILFSGGADSILLINLAKRLKKNPYCIIIDYNQIHIEEIDYAKEYLNKLNISYHVIKIDNLKIDSRLTGNLKSEQYDNVSEFNIPGRNTIFLSIAFGIAESKGIKEIWYGSNFSDREDLFPDTYQEYVCKINELFKIAGSFPIKVYAPLMGFSKEMVLQFLESCNVNKNIIFSGYGNL